MPGRYRRLVPRTYRDLITAYGLKRPNWFIGAAEQPFDPRDPALVGEIDRVVKRIEDRHGARSAGSQTTEPVRDPVRPGEGSRRVAPH